MKQTKKSKPSRKTLQWAEQRLIEMRDTETIPKLRVLWDNAAKLAKERQTNPDASSGEVRVPHISQLRGTLRTDKPAVETLRELREGWDQ